jgi:beta-lactamase class A
VILAGWPAPAPAQWDSLSAHLAERLAREPATVSVAVLDPSTGRWAAHLPDVRMHAASTMKVPVLIELVRRIDRGELHWDDSMRVRNRFASLVDGSPFTVDSTDDSDSSLYRLEGRSVTIRRLAELMIEKSSNFATNLIIARLGAEQVNATAHALGADSIAVRRGVEDSKAYAAGLNNTTTARDLATLLGAIVNGRAASDSGTREIERILLAQHFNNGIPAGLPAGVRVAHKTGDITGIHHDAAIVYPPNGSPFVLVVLTRGYDDPATAERVMADVAALVYRDVEAKAGSASAR